MRRFSFSELVRFWAALGVLLCSSISSLANPIFNSRVGFSSSEITIPRETCLFECIVSNTSHDSHCAVTVQNSRQISSDIGTDWNAENLCDRPSRWGVGNLSSHERRYSFAVINIIRFGFPSLSEVVVNKITDGPWKIDVSGGPSSDVLKFNLEHQDSWRFTFTAVYLNYSDPRAVSFSSRSSGFSKSQIYKDETRYSDNSRATRQPIKPYGYPDLPIPEAPLFGFMATIIGLYFSNKALKEGNGHIRAIGWIVAVAGGVVTMLWIIPILAILLSGIL